MTEIIPAKGLHGGRHHVGGRLVVDLEAARWNYQRLCQDVGNVAGAAVVKADAYGLGVERLAPAFAEAGARSFFTATIEESLRLRDVLGGVDHGTVEIFVLNGLVRGAEADLIAAGVIPVLNSLGDIELWATAARRREQRLPAVIHLDTGINRLGLPPVEVDRLAEQPELLAPFELRLVMSHLACGEVQGHPENEHQLQRFRERAALLPAAPRSLVASSGIFLGPRYHFDMVRPGLALYGVNPTPGQRNPMRRVVGLQARVLQVRELGPGEGVGYGLTYVTSRPLRVATVGVGYADGYSRHLSNSGRVVFAGQWLPIVGRVSMDCFTVDASTLPPDALQPGDFVELIGDDLDPDEMAARIGTIGEEALTSLGHRFQRIYRDGAV